MQRRVADKLAQVLQETLWVSNFTCLTAQKSVETATLLVELGFELNHILLYSSGVWFLL